MKIQLSVFIVLFGLSACLALPQFQGRIINGYEAEPGQFPYQVLVKFAGEYTCGGAILNEKWIVTAASCTCGSGTTPYPAVLFSAYIGSTKINASGLDRRVSRIITYPGFERQGEKYNIALLELEKPLEFSKDVEAIELADGLQNPKSGETIYVSGFGYYSVQNPNKYPMNLQYDEDYKLMNDEQCAALLDRDNDGSFFCLSHKKNRGLCGTDIGDPAAADDKLVGIAALRLSKDCGTDTPDVYSRISYFNEWIQETISA